MNDPKTAIVLLQAQIGYLETLALIGAYKESADYIRNTVKQYREMIAQIEQDIVDQGNALE